MKHKLKRLVALAIIAFMLVGITAGALASVKSNSEANGGVADTTITIDDTNKDEAISGTQNSISNDLANNNGITNNNDTIKLVKEDENLTEETKKDDTGSSANVFDYAFLYSAYVNKVERFLGDYNSNYCVSVEKEPAKFEAALFKGETVELNNDIDQVAGRKLTAVYQLDMVDDCLTGEVLRDNQNLVLASRQRVTKDVKSEDVRSFIQWHLIEQYNYNVEKAMRQLIQIYNDATYNAWKAFSNAFTNHKYGNMRPIEVAKDNEFAIAVSYKLESAIEPNEGVLLKAVDRDYACKDNYLELSYGKEFERAEFDTVAVHRDYQIVEKRAARRINPFERIVKAYIDAENTKKQMAINLFDHYNDMLNEYNRKLNEYVETVYNSFWHFKAPKAAKKAYVAEAACARKEVAIAVKIPQEAFAYKVLKEEFIPDEKATFLLVDEAKDAELDCAEAAVEMVDALADAQPAAAEPEPAAEAPVEVEFPPAAQAAPEMVAVQQAAE